MLLRSHILQEKYIIQENRTIFGRETFWSKMEAFLTGNSIDSDGIVGIFSIAIKTIQCR